MPTDEGRKNCRQRSAQQRNNSLGRAAGAGEGFDVGHTGKSGCAERLAVCDIGPERCDPGLSVDRARLGVRGRDGAAKTRQQRLIDFAGDVGRGCAFHRSTAVSTAPFDRRASTAMATPMLHG